MNQDKDRELRALMRRNPFWIILILLVALAGDYTFRMFNLIEQRHQLSQTQVVQSQNQAVLVQAQQLERRLQGLSLELLQVAKTNATASQIVRDFNIQWNPEPAASSADTQQSWASSAKSGGLQK